MENIMTTSGSAWPYKDASSSIDINDLLAQIEPFIFILARKWVPYNAFPSDVIDMEIDEIVQNTRIKLWVALQKEHITNLKAYIGRIVYTESINIARRYRRTTSLTFNEDGEICIGAGHTLLMNSYQGALDPASEFERQEEIIDSAEQAAKGVLALPPRQQEAMLCALKERVVDILPLVDIFIKNGLDIEAANWSDQKDEIQRLRASLSIARQRLRSMNTKKQW
jgi:DNA-directed RNA polymerase specialized sigma24 family protein